MIRDVLILIETGAVKDFVLAIEDKSAAAVTSQCNLAAWARGEVDGGRDVIAGPTRNRASGRRTQRKRIAADGCNAHPGYLRVIFPSPRLVDHAQQKQRRYRRKHSDEQANECHPDAVGIMEEQPGHCDKDDCGKREEEKIHPLNQPVFRINPAPSSTTKMDRRTRFN